MEALNFLKFWKPTIPFPTPVIELRNDAVEEEEEEDSFFDLEITPPEFDEDGTKQSSNDGRNPIPKRRIVPHEPPPPQPSKPQSPITLLRSAPNFRAFSFKKSKPGDKAREPASRCSAAESPRQDQPKPISSRDVIQRYLKLVRPLYGKVASRRGNDKPHESVFGASPSASPAGPRAVPNQLGKSKSTTTTSNLSSFKGGAQTTSSSSSSCISRRDDSLLLQHDGIQSAILHCKKSFNSSRDSCSLSRSTSDSSSMKSYSTDSYRISNSASETSHDNSARNSIEDGRCSTTNNNNI